MPRVDADERGSRQKGTGPASTVASDDAASMFAILLTLSVPRVESAYIYRGPFGGGQPIIKACEAIARAAAAASV